MLWGEELLSSCGWGTLQLPSKVVTGQAERQPLLVLPPQNRQLSFCRGMPFVQLPIAETTDVGAAEAPPLM